MRVGGGRCWGASFIVIRWYGYVANVLRCNPISTSDTMQALLLCGVVVVKKDDRQTNVRLPADLKDRITEAAEAASRSFTAELVARLEASFDSFLLRRVQELEQLLEESEKLRSIASETFDESMKVSEVMLKQQAMLVSDLLAVRTELKARDDRLEAMNHQLQVRLDRLDERDLALSSLLETAEEVLRWWDAVEGEPDAQEYRESLHDAMDDLNSWVARLRRLETK
ncbi:Arc family DNA-binding protein [Stenotrophomonas maltophilia]|nr:Arc family DNA-binding protein [Stenotrophomonas maltophilia]